MSGNDDLIGNLSKSVAALSTLVLTNMGDSNLVKKKLEDLTESISAIAVANTVLLEDFIDMKAQLAYLENRVELLFSKDLDYN